MMAFKFLLSYTLLFYVYGLRVSPKIDFSEVSSVNSGFRPITYGNVPTFENEHANFPTTKPIKLICDQSSCNTTNSETGSENGISTDVLVHIRADIHTNESKKDNIESVPNVPVIVGTKGNTISSSDVQFTSPNIIPSQIDVNYPPNHESSYFEFQSIPNFQRNHLIPIVNNVQVPELSWYPSRRHHGAVRNPVEFKKTYNINHAPLMWSHSDLINSDSTMTGNTPSAPCICDNRRLYNTPGYFSHNAPPGIDEKLNPLI